MIAKKAPKKTTKKAVLVRTYSAGVHCGYLKSHKDREVVLSDARRIWRWRGANTLHELSLRGCDDEWTRISEQVAEITLTEAIEILPLTEEARKSLWRSRWAK